MNSDMNEVSSNAVFKRVDDWYCEAIAEALALHDSRVVQFIWTLINGVLLEQVGGHSPVVFAEQVDLLTQMLMAYFEKFPG